MKSYGTPSVQQIIVLCGLLIFLLLSPLFISLVEPILLLTMFQIQSMRAMIGSGAANQSGASPHLTLLASNQGKPNFDRF